jgi:hypothetical protein
VQACDKLTSRSLSWATRTVARGLGQSTLMEKRPSGRVATGAARGQFVEPVGAQDGGLRSACMNGSTRQEMLGFMLTAMMLCEVLLAVASSVITLPSRAVTLSKWTFSRRRLVLRGLRCQLSLLLCVAYH